MYRKNSFRRPASMKTPPPCQRSKKSLDPSLPRPTGWIQAHTPLHPVEGRGHGFCLPLQHSTPVFLCQPGGKKILSLPFLRHISRPPRHILVCMPPMIQCARRDNNGRYQYQPRRGQPQRAAPGSGRTDLPGRALAGQRPLNPRIAIPSRKSPPTLYFSSEFGYNN